MNHDLIFYTNPMSRGRMVRWMLEETGASYQTEYLNYGTTMKAEAYLAINPMGKVPAIKHGDTIVTETPAICVYLADAFPEANLVPPLADRGSYYRWLFFAAGPLEMAVTNKAFGFEPPADKAGMISYGTYHDAMNALEQAVSSKPYIAGEHFSAADVYVASHISFSLRYNMIEKRPAFSNYVERMTQRDAYKRATAKDDEAMAALQKA